MTTPTAEIQKVTFNREYKLVLTDFDEAALKFGEGQSPDAALQKYFEDTLVAKIFGLERDPDVNGQVAFKRYSNLKYKIMYAAGNDGGDTKKCIFGIVSDVDATIKPDLVGTGKPSAFIPEKKYMFVFAHKSEDSTTTPTTSAQNILRVHEIVDIPNTHFVSASNATGTPAVPNTVCGLFAGPAPAAGSAEANCILGFFAAKKTGETTDTQFFYLPTKSYCLEGKSLDFLNLPDPYTGRFEVSTPYSSDRTSA